MAEPIDTDWPIRREHRINARCPLADADPSQAVIEVWHNFTGPPAEYRREMGEYAGPPHARIQIKHCCGWSVRMAPVPLAWTYVADAVLDHFGSLDTEVPRG